MKFSLNAVAKLFMAGALTLGVAPESLADDRLEPESIVAVAGSNAPPALEVLKSGQWVVKAKTGQVRIRK